MPMHMPIQMSMHKGFGFIKPSDGGDDVFCHRTALVAGTYGSDLPEGEPVTYELDHNREGKVCAKLVQANKSGGNTDAKADR